MWENCLSVTCHSNQWINDGFFWGRNSVQHFLIKWPIGIFFYNIWIIYTFRIARQCGMWLWFDLKCRPALVLPMKYYHLWTFNSTEYHSNHLSTVSVTWQKQYRNIILYSFLRIWIIFLNSFGYSSGTKSTYSKIIRGDRRWCWANDDFCQQISPKCVFICI